MNTVEKLIESNRLIAEFMGYDGQHEDWCGNNILEPDNFLGTDMMRPYNPNECWSDLMPVVEKISKYVIKGNPPYNSDQYARVEIVPNGYVRISNLRAMPITTNVSIQGSLIAAIWLACTKFIEWHNLNHTLNS